MYLENTVCRSLFSILTHNRMQLAPMWTISHKCSFWKYPSVPLWKLMYYSHKEICTLRREGFSSGKAAARFNKRFGGESQLTFTAVRVIYLKVASKTVQTQEESMIRVSSLQPSNNLHIQNSPVVQPSFRTGRLNFPLPNKNEYIRNISGI